MNILNLFVKIESLSLICKILSMQNYEDVINNGPFIISNGMYGMNESTLWAV